MMNDLTSELGRRKRAAWGAFKSIEDVVKRAEKILLLVHLFNTTTLPALSYASESWASRKKGENAIKVIEPAIEMPMLEVSRFKQVKEESFEVHSYVTGRRSKTLPHLPRKVKLDGADNRVAF
ncbi:hypothetical protein RB195_023872 [Necator americanus]|uniref:Uncharacterized protein n=1 Tax=Necator americanus TaxID=51031 RepID=A0ABR1ENA2_NECAM